MFIELELSMKTPFMISGHEAKNAIMTWDGLLCMVALNDHNLVVEIHGTNIAAYRGNTWWSKIGRLTVSTGE